MKTLIVSLLIVISSTIAAAATADLKSELKTIAEAAELGNGGYNIKSYEVKSLDAAKLLIADMKTVKKEYPHCGPYKTTEYRRDSIAAIKTLGADEKTASALTELYNQGKIVKMYSISTNNDIDCSRLWVEIFAADGSLLELYYGMND